MPKSNPMKLKRKNASTACLIMLYLFFTSSILSGGTEIQIKVSSFEKGNTGSWLLKFRVIDTNGLGTIFSTKHENTIKIKFQCNHSFYKCLLKKRNFTKKQHDEAINFLIKNTTPGKVTNLGVIGGGCHFEKEKTRTCVSNGIFLSKSVVYTYKKIYF